MPAELIVVAVGALAFTVSFFTTPLAMRLARRLQVQDRPSERKLHDHLTPTLGGLAIIAGWSVAFLARGASREAIVLLGCMAVLGVVGFIDDRKTVSERVRLGLQVVCALVAWLAGIRLTPFELPVVDALVTIVWLVGITNAFNFMDNMDGLAAGVGAIGALSMGAAALISGQYYVPLLAFGLAGACLGFLPHNSHPARVFMGDTGSMPLGFGLAVVGAELEPFGLHPLVAAAVPIVALGLFVIDTSVMTFGRIIRREPVIGGRMDHTSHRLFGLGLSSRSVVRGLYAVAAIYGLAAVSLTMLGTGAAAAELATVATLSGAGVVVVLLLPPLIRTEEGMLSRPPAWLPFTRALHARDYDQVMAGHAVAPSIRGVAELVAIAGETPIDLQLQVEAPTD